MLPGFWRDAASLPMRNRKKPRCRRADAGWIWSGRIPCDLHSIRQGTRSWAAGLCAGAQCAKPDVCWVADRRANPAGVLWFSYETATTIQSDPITRLCVRPRGDAEARSAPDACAAAGLSRAAGRSRATLSNASLAKVRAAGKRLSSKLTADIKVISAMPNEKRNPFSRILFGAAATLARPFASAAGAAAAGLSWTPQLLKQLEWRRFEELCAAYFETLGFRTSMAQSG